VDGSKKVEFNVLAAADVIHKLRLAVLPELLLHVFDTSCDKCYNAAERSCRPLTFELLVKAGMTLLLRLGDCDILVGGDDILFLVVGHGGQVARARMTQKMIFVGGDRIYPRHPGEALGSKDGPRGGPNPKHGCKSED
jgi:hypothetical protein